MSAVFIAWVAYLAFCYMIISHRIQISGFIPSMILLIVLFFILVFWSVRRSMAPKKAQTQASRQFTNIRIKTDHTASTVSDIRIKSDHTATAVPDIRIKSDYTAASVPDSGSDTFRVAGTTFDNDDGSSRQEILQHLKFADSPWADGPDDLTASLEETTFDGEKAIEVWINGYQVGYVPKAHIRAVSKALEHTATCYVSSVRILGGGTGDDGRDLSYGCEITLEY